MRIQRTRLLTLVVGEIERLEVAERARVEREEARNEVALRRYLETLPHWRTFANRLRRAVAAGQPITSEMVPAELRARYSDALPWWRPVGDVEVRPVAEGLRALRRVLELADDEYVTTTALERQGFPLGKALRGIR